MTERRDIYLDHAATTPVLDGVLRRMLPFFQEKYGNPSSVHSEGRKARHAVEEAREQVAGVLGVSASEIIFTSGGAEANNLALSSLLMPGVPSRLITCATEHATVLRPAEMIRERGVDVTVLPVSDGGEVEMESLAEEVSRGSALVSVMQANNETGCWTDIEKIYSLAVKSGGYLHSDCVQSFVFYNPPRTASFTDMMTISGHKLGGPKGIGVLYVSERLECRPMILGGSQERDRRAGTENVAGIVGMAEAVTIAVERTDNERQGIRSIRDLLARLLKDQLGDHVRIITPLEFSTPHILSVVFTGEEDLGLDTEMLILGLDLEGLQVSSGAACSSGTVKRSHVMSAIGLPEELSSGTVRYSLGFKNSSEDVQEAAVRTADVVRRLIEKSSL